MNTLANSMAEKARKLAWGIAYCLAYDRGVSEAVMGQLRQLVEAEPMPQGSSSDEVSLIAEAARLIAGPTGDEKEPPQTKEALQNSRLMQLSKWLNSPRIALVMGGATKIKQYVFESAKLPEIRGASGLLDRINLRDVPALFAQEPYWLKELRCKVEIDREELEEAERLVKQVREGFQARYGVELPDCEESIIYANGGEVLAFASLKLADSLTEAIERLYTRETLTANSVAVWRSCMLMELRFGLRPLEFWTDELTAHTDESLQELLRDYYGGLDTGSFFSRKTFGEVAAALALEKLRRREGNRLAKREPKPAPHFEAIPYARRCQSCERRNAIVESPRGSLCEPCARKRVFGQKAKREVQGDREWFNKGGFDWEPLAAKAWGTRFEEWLCDSGQAELEQGYYHEAPKDQVYPAKDLDDIAAAAQPEGFIGIVYADGNNIGALLEELQTPADYQEFAQGVYEATIEATFTALVGWKLSFATN